MELELRLAVALATNPRPWQPLKRPPLKTWELAVVGGPGTHIPQLLSNGPEARRVAKFPHYSGHPRCSRRFPLWEEEEARLFDWCAGFQVWNWNLKWSPPGLPRTWLWSQLTVSQRQSIPCDPNQGPYSVPASRVASKFGFALSFGSCAAGTLPTFRA
jgi:hypothetical protein